MDTHLAEIKTQVYDRCSFEISHYRQEPESKEYHAARFSLNGHLVISRTAKVTPKKIGQFVTFWKRQGDGPIAPFDESDSIDFFVIQVKLGARLGQFVFPKALLIEKGILSTNKREGKRGFRVYPPWDKATSRQAQQTQQWQLKWFYEVEAGLDLQVVRELYRPK